MMTPEFFDWLSVAMGEFIAEPAAANRARGQAGFDLLEVRQL